MKYTLLTLGLVLGCQRSEAPNPSAQKDAQEPASATAAKMTGGRDYINIVGSSTVYPFATVVAEQFGRAAKFKTPKVEATGTGGGLKLFCGGVGLTHPDIATASRRIKPSEVQLCSANGVKEIVELEVGHDGIVLANSKASKTMSITSRQLWLALAKQVPSGDTEDLKPNPYQKWSEIDAALPDQRIEVLGPPPTSGTRDALVELGLESGCKSFPWIRALSSSDEPRYKSICHTIREDGRFIEASENDNLIVQKLGANPSTFGVFGFSFLDQNAEKVQAAQIDGIAPTAEAIASRAYSLSRPLYLYVKKAHVGTVPGLSEYIAEFTSSRAWGPEGYLIDKGMIPLPEAERARFRDAAVNLTPLQM